MNIFYHKNHQIQPHQKKNPDIRKNLKIPDIWVYFYCYFCCHFCIDELEFIQGLDNKSYEKDEENERRSRSLGRSEDY